MGTNKILEIFAVSHFSEVNGAEILQHWLDVFHHSVGKGPFIVEGQKEVDFAVGSEFSCIVELLLLAISRALVWSGSIMKLEPKIIRSN